VDLAKASRCPTAAQGSAKSPAIRLNSPETSATGGTEVKVAYVASALGAARRLGRQARAESVNQPRELRERLTFKPSESVA
jgi:hypothetical protein